MTTLTEPLMFDELGPDGEPVQPVAFERTHVVPLHVTENELTLLFALVKKHDPKGKLSNLQEELLVHLTRWPNL